MQRFDHGQTVYVYWREAIYPATYKGYDNFEREKSHLVEITAAGGEHNIDDDKIFGNYQNARRNYPRATDHVKGM